MKVMKNTTWFVKREESIHEEKYLEHGIHRQIRVKLFVEIRNKRRHPYSVVGQALSNKISLIFVPV